MTMNDETGPQDAVISRLLRMGIFDWEEPNTRLHQATQAMHHSSALGCRLLGRILMEERKVCIRRCFFVVVETHRTFSATTWR